MKLPSGSSPRSIREKTYPYEYVCFRITGYRPTSSAADARSPATICVHDLRLFVEDLSDSADMAADNIGEQVLTVEELAKQFNVSTKTISRWRELGLVSRRLVFDGRKRVGFLRSSVDRFVKNNQERVARGARFSQLTDEQRQEIIDRARRLASAGGGQSEISRRLAKRAGRSVETIRSTIRQFDKQHPELAIFPDLNGPLTEAQKTRIYQAFQARRVGRQADEAVRPHEDDDLSRDQRSARGADHGAAAGFHPQPAVCAQGRRQGVPGPDARERRAGEEGAAAVRLAAVPGEPVRDAAAHARAGSALVPQVQLPEVQGGEAPRGARSGAAEVAA